MKGLLIAHEIVPPKTHNLLTLHLLLKSAVSEWDADVESLRALNYAARDFRYPGEIASFNFAERCIKVASPIRELLLVLLRNHSS